MRAIGLIRALESDAKMYIDLELQSELQPYVSFDWRLIAERGLRCYGHFHLPIRESKTVASCEISFLVKASDRSECVLMFDVENIISSINMTNH